MHRIAFLLCACCLVELGLLAQSLERTAVIARAGDLYITEKEFLQRFELLPGLSQSRRSRVEQAKLELLYSLIGEKLLAQEAIARKLDQDSILLSAYEDIRKMLARDRLYREEVSSKVTLSDKEINQAVEEAQRELLVSFVYFRNREDAEFIRRQMVTPSDFEKIELDSSLGALRDTATVIWGDADPAIERSAYSLKTNEISSVVPAGSGFYILRVSAVRRSSYFNSLQFSVLREKVIGKLRERKEEARLDIFTRKFFKDEDGYSRPEPLARLAQAMTATFARDTSSGTLLFTEEKASEVKERCAPWLSDTISVAGRRGWTTGEVIDQLFLKRFKVSDEKKRSLPHLLNNQLRVWVQQELLAEEALRRGLDRRPGVQRELEVWHQSYLAHAMKQYIRQRTSVADSEIWTYLESVDSTAAIPKVQIRELQTGSLDEMSEALAELERGLSFEEAVQRWSNDPKLIEKHGLTEAFSISERYPIGELAWQMEIGERYGPLKLPRGYLYFELVAKERESLSTDSSFVRKSERARRELLRMKEKRMMDLFLAQVGEKRGFDVFQDRLARIKVTPIPMMTFRTLGFGGRMFAVPFVDRQIDWINVEPPAGIIVQ